MKLVLVVIYFVAVILGLFGLSLGIDDIKLANKYGTPVQEQNLQRCIREYRAAHPSDLDGMDFSLDLAFQKKAVSFCTDRKAKSEQVKHGN